MDRVCFLEHKGKKILYVDYYGLKVGDIQSVLDEVKKVIVKEPKGTVLTLCNFENMRFDTAVINQMKLFTAETIEYNKAIALIGIRGLQKIAYEAVSKFVKREMPLFNTREEALNWLVEK